MSSFDVAAEVGSTIAREWVATSLFGAEKQAPGVNAAASGFRRLSFIRFPFEFSQNSNGVTEVNNLSRFRQRVVDARRGWSAGRVFQRNQRRPLKQLAALDYRARSRPDQVFRNLETLVNRLKTTMFDS